MTNKKKSGVRKDKPKEGVPPQQPHQSSTAAPMMPRVQPGVLYPGQFIFLILLAMGVSRILQVRSAYSFSSSSNGEETNGIERMTPSPVCVEYLGGDAPCVDATIVSLLKLKFHSALHLTALVVALALQVWNTDVLLQQLNALCVLAPLGVGIAALAYSTAISQTIVWRQALMGTVLAVLAAPTTTNLPFVSSPFGNRRLSSAKSLTSMALAGLALSHLFRAAHFVLLTTTNTNTSPEEESSLSSSSSSIFVIHPSLLREQLRPDVALFAAAQPILLFLAVDAIAAALVTALAWHTLPDRSQRVCFLF